MRLTTNTIKAGLIIVAILIVASLLLIQNQSSNQTNSVPLTTQNHPWPMFHGTANHTGFADVTGPKTATLLWKVLIGQAQGNPPNSVAIAVDKTIYVAGSNTVAAISPAGKIIWQTNLFQAQGPAIGVALYVAAEDSIVALDQSSGKILWQFSTGGKTIFGPTIASDGTIYQGSWDSYLYALYPDGKLKWRFKTEGAVSYPPSLGADGIIYLGGGDAHSGPDRYLYALNPNGRLRWKVDTGAIRSGSPAIGLDGTIYTPASPSLIAVDASGEIDWSKNQDNTGNIITGIISPAIGSDGTIYVGSFLGNIYAIDPASQNIKWTYSTVETGQTNTGLSSFPVVDRDGTVYLGSRNGKMYAIDRNGQLLWNYQTSGPITEAAPALGPDGTIYFTSEDGYLYAIKDQ